MLVLPKAGQSTADARRELLREIDDRLTIVLVARGDDEATRAFVRRAEQLARLRRRVVHLEDSAILWPQEERSWFGDDDGDAVIGAVLSEREHRCGRVLRRRQSRVNIERAFLACEKARADR